MAERRMFTMQIVDSDAFLDMPLSTQCLYFHLNMRADDDGFVNNPKKIIRMIGASEDDLKILLMKRFVIGFDTKGVLVIKHWRMNNYLRKDRYHPTQYQDELHTLGIKENGAYTQNLALATSGIPNGNQCVTEDSIDKDSIDKNNNILSSVESEFDQLWCIYPRKQGKKKAFDAYKRARKNGTTYEEVKKGIESYVAYIKAEKIDDQFIKHGATFFSQNAWQDEYKVSKGVSGVMPDDNDDLDGIL